MAKLALLLLLMVCIHASLAGFGGKGTWKKGAKKWVKNRLNKLGLESPWGSESGESHPSTNKKNGREEPEEGRHYGKKRDEEMPAGMMMMMRMKKMFKPLRDLFVKQHVMAALIGGRNNVIWSVSQCLLSWLPSRDGAKPLYNIRFELVGCLCHTYTYSLYWPCMFSQVLDLGPKETEAGKPTFCHDNECPSFNVLNKSEHYQVRVYEPSHWVSTSMQAKKMTKPSRSCFWRLFRYIQGNNVNQQKIKMTVPVTTVYKKDPATENVNITMSFYLPPSIINPPSPNDDAVSVKRKESFKVFVHSFGGFTSQRVWEKHVKMLQRMLDRDGFAGQYYRPDEMFVTAGYDDPMQLFNRHNEVWFVAKDQEA